MIFIQQINCMEKFMDIKFADLKKQYIEMCDIQWKLQRKLQDKAAQLMDEYLASLGLDGNVWYDTEGNGYPYVDFALSDSQGKYRSVERARLQMDEKHALNFVVKTTINDNPLNGGESHGISVSLRYEGDTLKATVGKANSSDPQSAEFNINDAPGGFYEVSGAIKALISAAMTKVTPTQRF